MQRTLFTGGKSLSPGQTQWAPTLTSHDPNPPISLESTSGIAHPLFGPFAGLLTGKFG